jgi:diguanylate cyclase (GGDEF)-like protein/PAS domain S-box-containing protein
MEDDTGLFRATFHDSPIGIAILDEVGHYREVNRAFAKILGLDPADVVSRNFAEFTHPDDLPRDIELLSQLARKEFPYYVTQKRYLTSTGEVAWVRITVTRIDDAVRTPSHNFIAQIEDVTEVRKAREALEQRALYDGLTGLANRALLMERIAAGLESHADRDTTVALIFLDVDDFKMVNDSLGHEAGDHLLTVLAQRIQGAVRRGDTVARIGGDEFIILLEDVRGPGDAEALAAVITRAAQRPVTISDHEVVPTVSAGLAIGGPGSTPEDLLRDADTAMYSAKQSGHARLKIYDTKLREIAVTKLEIEEDLRKALREGELRVAYQPVLDLATREAVGYEALVRWSHPLRGELLPDEFIAIAEQANLVVPIGSLVTHEACDFLARHPSFTGKVFVNASPKHLGTASLAHTLEAAVSESDVAPERVCVEVTESGMIRTSKAADNDLDSIHELGHPIILDDFGAGSGALATILDKPISGIKLSNRFTRRLGDGATGDKMSRGIALLANDLGLMAGIKGLETEEQLATAIKHGWTMGQGYLFGHPVAEAELGLA